MKIPFLSRSKPPAPIMGRRIRSQVIAPQHAEMIREINGRMLRMYEAAVSNNLNADFPVSISSANAEIFTSIWSVRARARTIERDNPYGWAMLESLRSNVGGSEPFRLEMKVGKKTPEGEFVEEQDTNDMIEEAWEEAGHPKNCTARRDMSRLELDLQTITAMVRDGGVLGRHRRMFPKNKFQYAIQPLEIDRLDHYWQGKNPKTGNLIKMSIEVDEFDGAVSYWLLTKHPGEIFYIGDPSKQLREEVPAEDIIALFDLRTRAEQLTAVSRFASVIKRLHRIDQFDEAHTMAAVFAACKPLFIIQEFPTAMEYVPDFVKSAMQAQMEGASGDDGEGEKVSNLEPATAETLPFGQKPFLVDPKFPLESATGFKKDSLRAAAAGSGTAYHMIGQDLEGVNFSSGRLGENQFQESCRILQGLFIEHYRRPHFEEWLKYAILSGQVKRPMSRYEEFCRAARFQGRTWDYVNPLQDAQADILLHEAGIKPRDKIIRERGGGGVHEVNAQYASDKKCDEAHGLDFSSADPTKPDVSKGEPGEEKPNPEGGEPELPPKKGGKQTIKAKNGHAKRSTIERMVQFAEVRQRSE